ncbi:cellulose biosynthesis cyclic di-GMP-binding regulatory protein BcsB [Stenotrophobium rhamnosiphilum]|nr:cellulose biosynthesis cyclic di-GMP-binding regulatory protein BcsB [Stenotrophobium rhamnosiphilum]
MNRRVRFTLMWMFGLAAFLINAQTYAAATPLSTVTPVPASEQLRLQTLMFKDMGHYEPVQLKGVDGRMNLAFGVRLDESVVSAKLKLRFSYSPALLPLLSHLKLVLNGEVVDALLLPKETAGTEVEREIELDPRYFTDYNNLSIQLVGHYTMECEDAMHSSIWASISNRSSLELTLRPLALQPGLSLLPAPFFDRRDNRRLDLPFVFAAKPSLATLRAAGVVASWFGAEAAYRSARFPTFYDQMPQRNAVVFATNAERPTVLQLPEVKLPTISVRPLPSDPTIKLLIIQGQDAAQLKTAADALVLGQVVLTGDTATITKVVYDPPRKAYDVPNWIRTDRPVKFSELVGDPSELQAVGHQPSPIRVNVRLPPDLLTWNRKGVPLDLKYRYTPPAVEDNSSLTVSINNSFVQAFRLRASGKGGDKGRLMVPVLDEAMAQYEESLVIPAFQVGSNNQLQFLFALDYHKEGQCKDSIVDATRSAIDPDSTIDLSPFPHYTTMPNLALFANAGFPFTKYADLSQTAVVVSNQPAADDAELMFFMLGRLGRVTGIPALRYNLVPTSAVSAQKDFDLLVINGAGESDLLTKWGKSLPAIIDKNRRLMTPLSPSKLQPGQLYGNEDSKTKSPWSVDASTNGGLAALIGFESPLQSGRSVVAVSSSGSEVAKNVVNAIEDDGLVSRIHGDIAFVRDRQIDSFQVNNMYYVGHLPWHLRIWFFLSMHPVLLAIFGLLAGLILAFLCYWTLRGVAARRMRQ